MRPSKRFPFPQVIDNTMRADWASCPTKFFYSFMQNLGPVYASTDLIAGGAFAKGLEVIRLAVYGDEKLPLSAAIERGCMAAIEAYGDHVPHEGKEQKGVDRVCTALVAYFEKYPPFEDYIQPYYVNNRPCVEFTFSIPLEILHPETQEPIIYAGRFDMLGVYMGQLICVDEKTTSQLGASWKNQWDLRSQFTGYAWAARQHKLPVVGCIARGVSFLKSTKANPIGHGFEESIQMRPAWMIDAWYEQLHRDIKNMIRAWEENWFDQNFADACANYSGCAFKALCTTPNPELWIEGRYLPRNWNPVEKVPYVQPKDQPVENIVDADLNSFLSSN